MIRRPQQTTFSVNNRVPASGRFGRFLYRSKILGPALLVSGWAAMMAGTMLVAAVSPSVMDAQAPAHQLGTVTSVTGSNLVLQPASGPAVTVSVGPGAAVLQLPPGSKTLKDATPATLADIAVGDRVLVNTTSTPGATDLAASRVIVMKASAIAARNESSQSDWRRNGVSGLVRSVDGPVISVASGGRAIQVQTTPTTVFRRYAAGSVSYSGAQPSTLAEIHPGDQLSVRGTKSADGSQISAQEIVAGTFQNLSGIISSIDPEAHTLTLKDLATKRTVTVQISPESDLRSLPEEEARALSARSRGAGKASPDSSPAESAKSSAAGAKSGEVGSKTDQPGGRSEAERTRNAGTDLSRMLSRLPLVKLSDLKPGDAVMIVASQADGQGPLTAITMLSGVEPLLTKKSSGESAITLSPWDFGTPAGGGA